MLEDQTLESKDVHTRKREAPSLEEVKIADLKAALWFKLEDMDHFVKIQIDDKNHQQER